MGCARQCLNTQYSPSPYCWLQLRKEEADHQQCSQPTQQTLTYLKIIQMEILDDRKQSNIYKQKAYPLISEVTSRGNALQTHEFEGALCMQNFQREVMQNTARNSLQAFLSLPFQADLSRCAPFQDKQCFCKLVLTSTIVPFEHVSTSGLSVWQTGQMEKSSSR